MTQVEVLYQLQQIELEVLRQSERLKVINEELEGNELVQIASDAVQTAKEELAPLVTQQRDLELQIQSAQEKQKESEQRLYSGEVTNPKELQDLQQEVESLQRRSADLEEKQVALLSQVEMVQAVLQEAEQNLEEIKELVGGEQANLLTEKTSLQESINAGLAQRRETLKAIEPENLKIYNALRTRKANQPVSLLRDAACSVCGIELTTTAVNELRRATDIKYCPNCGRILIYQI